MRRRLSATIIGLLLSVSFVMAQPPKTIIVGTVYNVFHEEYPSNEAFFLQVDQDVSRMKAAGINHVMIFPMGQWDPETKQLVWKRTDYLVDKIAEAGMKFVPIMLKEEQCSYYFPIWKFREIRGMWDRYNLNNGSKNNRENVDFADPVVYPVLEAYFKAVVKRYGRNPALSFYNIWNEPHYSSTGPHVIVRFRKWLQQKYGSLSVLRSAWAEEYSTWDEVSPFLAENWDSSLPQIDWIVFRNELNGILLSQLVQTLRKYDPVHAVNANPVGTPWANFSSFGMYNIDDRPIAEHNDINGFSYYPDIWEREHQLQPAPSWLHDLSFSVMRCSSPGKNYILTELYTNAQNGLALNGYLDKTSVKLLAWTALANDCKGMIYWKWSPFMRGRQSLGRGLCRVDGQLAPRGEAVKDLGTVITTYGEKIFQAHLKQPRVAILVDMVGLLKTLEQTTEPSTTKFMYESVAGVFKALDEANITADMLRMDRGIDLKALRQYRIVYLPFQIVMRKAVADVLNDYVRDGGWLVADARTAIQDEKDVAYGTSPGAGLDELFGVVRPDWTGQKAWLDVQLTTKEDRYEFKGKYFGDQLVLKDHTTVLGTFAGTQEPALVEHQYGKGTAVLSAVPLGASYYDSQENPVNRFITAVARRAGAFSDAEFFRSGDSTFSRALMIRVHTAGASTVIYVINEDSLEVAGRLSLAVADTKIRSVTDIVSGGKIAFAQKGQTTEIPMTVASKDVVVLLLEP